jgi:hypothetical protein
MAHTPKEPVMARPVVTGSVLAELTAQYAPRTEEEKVELFKQLVTQEAARGSNLFKIPGHMPFLTRDRAMRLGFQWEQSYENMGPQPSQFLLWEHAPELFAESLKRPPPPMEREDLWRLYAMNGYHPCEETRVENLPVGVHVHRHNRYCTFWYTVVCWYETPECANAFPSK